MLKIIAVVVVIALLGLISWSLVRINHGEEDDSAHESDVLFAPNLHEDVTVGECLDFFEKDGVSTVLHNGKVIGYEKYLDKKGKE